MRYLHESNARPMRWAVAIWIAAAALPIGLQAQMADESAQDATSYRVYVANESSDIISRVVFTPGVGVEVEDEIPVGIMPGDIDGPHGLATSPDGEFFYVTIAHGTPYGTMWQFHAGPDTLVAKTELGLFPATMGLTPGGEIIAAVNFNLHGDMVPSDLSLVYAPEMLEIARVQTCLMPHGSRVNPSGTKHYSVCMHSDQLVELDLNTFQISKRYSLAPGHEMELALDDLGEHMPGMQMMHDAVCSPTWVEPAYGARADRFLYIACNKNQEILEIDVESWEVSRRFATGAGPYNLETTQDGRYLVATLKGEQGIAVYDLDSGELAHRFDSTQPVTHGVTSSPDGRYVFVTNESVGAVFGTLDVIDLETMELVGSTELRHQPGGIDFWKMDAAQR